MYRVIKSSCFSIIIFFSFLFSSTCIAQTKLPNTWPPDMKLTMSYGGGMTDYSYSVQITSDSAYMQVKDGAAKSNNIVKLSQQQLDNLLVFLKKHRFEKLKTEPSLTYDKGTESVSIVWDNHAEGIGESHASRVIDEDRNDYNEIINYLTGLFAQQEQ